MDKKLSIPSHFVSVKILKKDGEPLHRTGVVVAHESSHADDLLVAIYITQTEYDMEIKLDKSPWCVHFHNIEEIRKYEPYEARHWEKSGEDGYIVFLAKKHERDEERNYEAFPLFKSNEPLRTVDIHGKGVVFWSKPGINDMQSNLNRHEDNNILSYIINLPIGNVKENHSLEYAAQIAQNNNNREDIRRQLTGAPIFREDGVIAGFCHEPDISQDVSRMRLIAINFDVANVLARCGKSRTYDAIISKKLKPCQWIRIVEEMVSEAKNTGKVDIGNYENKFSILFLDDDFIHKYFYAVNLEQFFLHVKSSLKKLLDGLLEWRNMLYSLHRLGKNSMINITLLGLLCGFSSKSYACAIHKLTSEKYALNIQESDSPLYAASTHEELIRYIRSLREGDPREISDNWHVPILRMGDPARDKNGKDDFVDELRRTLNDKKFSETDKRNKLGELVDNHLADDMRELIKTHAKFIYVFHHLLEIPPQVRESLRSHASGMEACGVSEHEGETFSGWKTLFRSIEQDIFCLYPPLPAQ